MDRNIIVFGAGGHAKVIIDAIEKQGRVDNILVYDDDPTLLGKQLFGYQVIGNLQKLLNEPPSIQIEYAVVAIGNISHRLKVAKDLERKGIKLGRVVHPSALISRGAVIGLGSVLFANAVVNADTKIGQNVIVNTSATVDHDCNIADGVHIGPGASICGGVTIGYGTFIGAGTVIIPGVKVGAHVIVGAGSTVLSDIKDNIKVAGSPAREI